MDKSGFGGVQTIAYTLIERGVPFRLREGNAEHHPFAAIGPVGFEHEGFALGFVTTRMFEAAVIVIGIVSLLAVVTLRQPGASGTHAAMLVTVGEALVAVRDWTFLLGPGLVPGINALLLGSLLYRSRLVPRVLPVMGLIGAPLLIAAVIAILFGGIQQISAWTALATLPVAAWEFSLGVWLVTKGFRPSPVTAGMTGDSPLPAYQDAAV